MMKRTVVTSAALSGALVTLALFAAPASAQESSANNLTEQLLTGLGLVAPSSPDIDYRERAPLVVPPSGDVLPPPRDASAMSSNPAWPKDFDDERRKKAAAADAIDYREAASRFGTTQYKPLTPAQMAKGTRFGAAQGSGYDYRKTNDSNQLSLNELGFKGWGSPSAKDKPLVFEGEPEREALIQPPVGYQTPAPNAPYGVVADRPEDKQWKMPSWFDRTQPN